MITNLTKDRGNKSAFTIVELLIVIVVIAILAAISIVAYNGIQNRARASAASSALSQAAKKIALYQVDNSAYPTTGNLAAAGVSNTGSTYYQYSSTGSTYCLTASVSGTSYNISNTNQIPQAGACSGQVDGGVITNLVVNPSFESNMADWALNTPGFTGTGSASTLTNGFSGTRSYRYTASTSGTLGSFGIYTQVYNVSSSSSYVASAYIRSNQALTYRIGAERRDSSGANIGTSMGSAVTLIPNTWTKLTATIPQTPNMTRFTLVIYSSNGSLNANSTIDFDAAMVTEGANELNYADGNTVDWTWNGSANNSTSTGPPV